MAIYSTRCWQVIFPLNPSFKNQMIFSEPQYKTAHLISPSHLWTSPNILCSANEYPPATVIVANMGKRNPGYGTDWNWKKGLQDLPHRESNLKSPGGPALPSQCTVTSKDDPMGLSQRAGEILWGYESILKHGVKGNCGVEQREGMCTRHHTEDIEHGVTNYLSTLWLVSGRQNPSPKCPGVSCCWKKRLEL